MQGKEQKIRCCSGHNEYQTPLIATFKFIGYEWWCPYCGAKYDFFDDFLYLHKSNELEQRLTLFKQISNQYLLCTAIKCGVPEYAKTYKLNQKPDNT